MQVSLYRQMAEGSITVDGSDVVTGRPAGPYVGLDIAQEVLFLGGLPAGVPPRGILGPGETVGLQHLYCYPPLFCLSQCVPYLSSTVHFMHIVLRRYCLVCVARVCGFLLFALNYQLKSNISTLSPSIL